MNSLINYLSNFNHNLLLLLGFSLLAATLGGRLFQKIKIPQVVAYILLGILVGKSGTGILSETTLESFLPVNQLALGLIGFMIGGELKIDLLRRFGKQFLIILLFEALTAFVFVTILTTAITFLLTGRIIFSCTVGLLLGSISSATAAAGTTDVIRECRAKGTLTNTILGIVALDDVLALLLFALSSSILTSLNGSADSSILLTIGIPLYELTVSVGLGWISGLLLSKAVMHYTDNDRVLIFLLGGILSLIGVALVLKVDMIMSCMIMGFVLSNKSGKKSEELFRIIDRIAPPIYILFFILVGANLKINAINGIAVFILAGYMVGRTAGKIIGARTGAVVSKSPQKVISYLMYTLFSQSGVAIGLSILALQHFPGETGSLVAVVVTASTFIVQLLGPIGVKYALDKSGESGLNITEEDILNSTPIGDFIKPAQPVIQAGDKLPDILKIFSQTDNLYYPVIKKNGSLAGVISVTSIKNTFLYDELSNLLAAMDIMEPCTITFDKNTLAGELLNEIKKSGLEYAAVCDKNQFTGLIETRNMYEHISRKLLEMESRA